MAPPKAAAAESPNGIPSAYAEPSRDQRIADLDRRDQALASNGTITVDEQQTVVDYRPAPAQTELPGIPEPAPRAAPPETDDDFDVPYEAQFNGRIAKSAPGLKAIAERLIARHPEAFAHLQDVEIRYFWKRRGGTRGGNPNLGGTQKPGGWLEYFAGGTTYMIWLAADHVREARLDRRQIEAAVFNRLCATAVDPKDHSAYRVVGPDFTGYLLELQVYGPWSAELKAIWDADGEGGGQTEFPFGDQPDTDTDTDTDTQDEDDA